MNVVFKNTLGIRFSNLKDIVCKDDLRPAMGGVFIDFLNQKLVATDAHVLVAYPIEVTNKESESEGVIVPVSFFNHLRYMQEIKVGNLDELTYRLTENYAQIFTGEELIYQCRYIDGKYPNWEGIVKDISEKKQIDTIGLNVSTLKKLTSSLPSFLTGGYRFELFGANKQVILTSMNADWNEQVKAIIMPIMMN
jgi:DNA polymerase III sliding clamp (beta) subunit (PCNA family)